MLARHAAALLLLATPLAGQLQWSRFAGPNPAPRSLNSMAYDTARQKTVLFAGEAQGGSRMADTWEYDASSGWRSLVVSGPPAREAHVCVYDAARAQTVLFGGDDGNGFLGDTWGFDGTRWRSLATTGPLPRVFPGAAYDTVRNRVVLFGGLA